METVNLVNNNQLTSMGSSSVDVLISPDFDGNPVGTILADGWPVIMLDPSMSRDGEWAWLEGAQGAFSTTWRMAAVELMVAVGEVSEDWHEAWNEAVGGPDEVEVWQWAMGEAASEGHGLLALIDQAMAVVSDWQPS